MKLNGDHCRCAACGEHFNSTYAFDMHRVGTHGFNRRCLDVTEMLDAGMAQNRGGWWISKARPAVAADARRGDRPATHSEVAG